MKRALRADLALILVAVSWGLTFPIIENGVKDTDPLWFVVFRMLIASLVLLPFVASKFKHTDKRLLLGGIILGFFNAGTFIFQTIGLESTTAALSGFITGTNVVMVPLLLPLFCLGLPKRFDLAGCFLCLGGVYILTGANWQHIGSGELWTLACAVSYAFAIVYLQYISRKTDQIMLLSFYQIFFIVPWAMGAALILHRPIHVSSESWHGILLTAVLCTSIALVLQTKFQRETTATHAAIIFSLEPVFATIFGWWLNKEPITTNIAIGGSVIIASLLAVEIGPRLWRYAHRA